MNKKLYFLLVSLCIYISGTNAQTINFHDTKGELTVDGSGAANYKVPIAIPPGIREVAPQIALTYSSNSNNGIAGQGWNLVGISSINRVSSRSDLDGLIDAVDFDENDQFSLDGQRLIKLSDGTLRTENYSNQKIVVNNGNINTPDYFIIYSPDGSKTYYGYVQNSKGVGEWLISKFIDLDGNTIKYEYINDNNVIYPKKIIWSENENYNTNYQNIIEFTYKNRLRQEDGFLYGNKLASTKILSKIDVYTGGLLFKSYNITYKSNELKYEFVDKIQEFNGNNEVANPITFDYNTSPTGFDDNIKYYKSSDSFYLNKVLYSGDFDGNSQLDFIVSNTGNKIMLNKIDDEDKWVSIPFSGHVVPPINTLNNNKTLQKQSLVFETNSGGYGSYFDQSILFNHKIYLKPQLLDVTTQKLTENYTKTINYPYLNYTINPDKCMNSNANAFDIFTGKPDTRYVAGDFNGDGISDYILLGKYHITRYEIDRDNSPANSQNRPEPDCNPHYSSGYALPYYIDMNPNLPESESYHRLTQASINYDDEQFVIDFDGDGKDDIISFTKYGFFRIYTFKNYQTSELLLSGTIPEYNKNNDPNKQILIGDFNGDGKTDLFIPVANKSSDWVMYLSKGNEFDKVNYQNFAWYEPNWGPGAPFDQRVKIRNYRAADLNNDGKSDFLLNEYESYCVGVATGGCNRNARGHFYLKPNLGSDNGKILFGADEYQQVYSNYGYDDAINLLTGEFSNSHNIIFIQGNQIWKGRYQKDNSKDKLLSSITESGSTIKTQIEYNQLKPGLANNGLGNINDIYHSNNSELYPFTEIKQLPSFNVVSKVSVSAQNKQKYKLYKYIGLTAHSGGLGLLGFKKVAQSSWMVQGINESSPIWNVTQASSSFRGAVIDTWSFVGNNLNLINSYTNSDIISKTTNVYDYRILSDKRYVLLPKSITINDLITRITTKTENTFDSYYNVLTSVESKIVNNQTHKTIKNNTLENSLNSTPYIIGRLVKETSKTEAYNDSYTVQKEYTYTNHNITKTKTTTQNTGIQTIDYTYDQFGNVLSIQDNGKSDGGRLTVSISPRKIENVYDSNGRFVIKKKDIEGYETNLQYNLLGQVTKETDKFGAVTFTEYDKWGKLLKVTLSNSRTTPIITQYQYNRNNNGWSIISSSNQTKEYTAQYFDAVGNNIKNTIKGFSDGQYVSTSTEYDFLGRKLKESEPYFTSPTQWTTYEYDYLLRPIRITTHTGLIVTHNYSGLTVTSKEGVRTKKVTKNAIGNITQLVDNSTETINYNYYAHGGIKTTTYGSHVITTDYDAWGRRTSLLDPSVSSIPYTYTYTPFDEISVENTPEASTTYKYDSFGKITEKKTTGKSNILVNYTYDNAKKGLLIKEYGTNEGNSFSNEIAYDNYYRVSGRNEITPKYTFGKQFVYDEFGRIMNSESWTMTNNKRIQTVILNHQYNPYNGELNLLLDISNGIGKVIWKANTKNERGETLNATLGGLVTIENTYDTYGNITNIRHKKGNSYLYSVDYEYQVDRGLLKKRNDSHFGWEENFTYDNFDRLTSWSSPNGTNYNTYLTDGRIDVNNQVGKYQYDSTTKYKKESIQLNPAGNDYYSTRKEQNITYDGFKRPLSISEEGRGNVNFQYGINGGRYFALKQDLLANKTVQKYYSQDGTIDITVDQNGNTKIVNYISSPYDTPFIYVTELNAALTTTKEGFHYLARDFQGSIMGIYDSNANVIERRLFDPWGNIVKVQDANGNVTEGDKAKLIFIDRGYTGHEHFTEVGIIHMNGRIYDPILKQFLSPDNFIQDSNNSQNYNRYGYAWNNPLKYVDPSGEEFIVLGSATLGAAIIGAIIGGVVYTGMSLYYGHFTWGGLFKNIGIGFISGAAASGIGSLAEALQPLAGMTEKSFAFLALKATFQMSMHAVSQGFIAGISGGDIGQSLLSGLVSSAVGSIVQLSGAKVFGNTDIDTILFGTASGGLTAELTGGNFWEGAAIGLTVSLLNHVKHKFVQKNLIYEAEKHLHDAGYDPNGKPEKTVKYANDMITKLKTLKNMSTRSGKNIRVTEINNEKYKGRHLGDGKIALSTADSFTFKSNTTLYLVLYHEALHVVYAFNYSMKNYRNNSFKKYHNTSGTLGEWEHYLIFKEMSQILLNGTSAFIYDDYNKYKSIFKIK